ncbi:hypothetical protein GCM10026983_00280 [Gracilibacillus alcaliphilus]
MCYSYYSEKLRLFNNGTASIRPIENISEDQPFLLRGDSHDLKIHFCEVLSLAKVS